MKNFEETKMNAYNRVKNEIENALKNGMLLNIKGLRAAIKDYSHRINVLEHGAAQDFFMTEEKADLVNDRLAEYSGRRQALREYLAVITK